MLRTLRAPNPSAMTLDGTRTYLVGHHLVAIIDPGPDLAAHVAAVVAAVGRANPAIILLTHKHPDHSAATARLAGRLLAPVRSIADGTLSEGDRIRTDAGELEVLHTPGHTPDHAAFYWRDGAAVFCGDLMMGGQDTALVAPPEGNLAEYLASLARIRALRPRTIFPAHGPPFEDPDPALASYVTHREEREAQVLAALNAGKRNVPAIVSFVYGDDLEADLRSAAEGAARAYLEHLTARRRARAVPGGWEPA